MVNKRGWLRIIEAGIGVLIIIGVLLIINHSKASSSGFDLSKELSKALEEISQDKALRVKIVSGNMNAEADIENFANTKIGRANIAYKAKVCDVGAECALESSIAKDKDIWSAERIISINVDNTAQYSAPKRVRIFAWKS